MGHAPSLLHIMPGVLAHREVTVVAKTPPGGFRVLWGVEFAGYGCWWSRGRFWTRLIERVGSRRCGADQSQKPSTTGYDPASIRPDST